MGLLTNPDSDMMVTWTVGLADIPAVGIKLGLKRAKDFVGFFNLPAFRHLCRITPQDLGLPSARDAMYEACNAPTPKPEFNWSHPAVFWAGVAVGWFDMAHKTENELFPIFESAYNQLVARVMAGESLEVPVRKALPAKVHIPADDSHAKQSISRIKSMLG